MVQEILLSSSEIAEIVLDTTNHMVMIEGIDQEVDKIKHIYIL